jgi:ElaB/YqjD/DUF883 family membrane-anchored ribosome-binding protein
MNTNSSFPESVNSKIDDLAGPASELKDKLARTAYQAKIRAEEIGRTAQLNLNYAVTYVRDHRMEEIVSDAEAYMGDHPGISLVAAAALGFLVGRTFRGED